MFKIETSLLCVLLLTLPAGASQAEESTPSPHSEPGTLAAHQHVELPSGVKLYLLPHGEVPLMAIEAVIEGGSVTDPPGKEGLTAITTRALRRGAGSRDANALAQWVDGHGVALSLQVSRDASHLSIEGLSTDREDLLNLLADLLVNPHLSDGEIAKLTARARDRVVQDKLQPSRVLMRYFAGQLFGEHPYARPSSGTESSLQRISPQDVRAHHTAHFGGDRLHIVISGQFDPAAVRDQLEDSLGEWRAATAAPVSLRSAARPKPSSLVVNKPDATQTYFALGTTGVSFATPDRAALALAHTVFGGRFTSRLNTALRIESGLTYGAQEIITRPRHKGELLIYSFTETSRTQEALTLARDVLATWKRDKMTQQELDSARAYLLGQYPPDLETASQLASHLALLALYGVSPQQSDRFLERVANTNLAEVHDVIERVYPEPDELVSVLIGNAAAIEETTEKLPAVSTRTLQEGGF